ncbi:hypothetical protein V8C42DRAFT_156212 [Trichoderma barbatum]
MVESCGWCSEPNRILVRSCVTSQGDSSDERGESKSRIMLWQLFSVARLTRDINQIRIHYDIVTLVTIKKIQPQSVHQMLRGYSFFSFLSLFYFTCNQLVSRIAARNTVQSPKRDEHEVGSIAALYHHSTESSNTKTNISNYYTGGPTSLPRPNEVDSVRWGFRTARLGQDLQLRVAGRTLSAQRNEHFATQARQTSFVVMRRAKRG